MTPRVLRIGWWAAGTEVALLGLGLILFVPANLALRRSSQDKAVFGNVRQLSAAADQYFLENRVTTVSYTDLVGPTNYLRTVNPIVAETYPAHFTQGVIISVTGVAGQRTITYAP